MCPGHASNNCSLVADPCARKPGLVFTQPIRRRGRLCKSFTRSARLSDVHPLSKWKLLIRQTKTARKKQVHFALTIGPVRPHVCAHRADLPPTPAPPSRTHATRASTTLTSSNGRACHLLREPQAPPPAREGSRNTAAQKFLTFAHLDNSLPRHAVRPCKGGSRLLASKLLSCMGLAGDSIAPHRGAD